VGADFGAGSMPIEDDKAMAGIKASTRGHLAAWDPVAQKEVWRVQYEHPWSGGALATAGDLVFAGSGEGEISAYKADTGSKLWTGATQGRRARGADDLRSEWRAVHRHRSGIRRRFALAAGSASRSMRT